MDQRCACPTSLNTIAGIYLIALGILSLLKVWDLNMPLWLILINLILGLLLIILNLLKRMYEGEGSSIKQADKMYKNERVI